MNRLYQQNHLFSVLSRLQTLFRPILITLAIVFATLLATTTAFAKQPDNSDWVASWGASPQSALGPFSGPPVQFENQTIRMVARISKGGDQLRVRFDNSFGAEALVIGSAHVALHVGGGSTAIGSDRTLSFGGSPTITIPPGAPAMSDAVDLKVADLSEIAISLYLPSVTDGTSIHSLGMQTTYISSPGDYSDTVDFPTQSTGTARYFLSGVDVLSEEKTLAIVTLGDSITDGFSSTVDANNRWPDQLAERLLAADKSYKLTVVNQGISGNRILHNVIGPNALSRFDRDVSAQTGVAFMTVLEGINDIGLSAPIFFPEEDVSADQIIQGYRQLISRAHSKCIKIIGATLTPFEGAIYYTDEGETKRQAVNDFIRNGGEFDAVIDFDLATRDPENPTKFLPAYDSGDNLHPSDAGYDAMANSIDLKIFAQPLKHCAAAR